MDTATLHQLLLTCHQVRIDSRLCAEGDLFFALHGQTDGNRFAADALARGARGAVVDDPALAQVSGCILVPDTLQALQDLARYHRRWLGLPVLALTGSNGKTTTKELLARVLARKFRVHATPGNYNNHIGVPLTLLGIPAGTEMAVVEMGANAQREIAALCAIAEPDYGLITNIGKAHLEGFGGPEGVRIGKGELYYYLKAHGKTIFYLADQPPLPEMVGDYQPAFGIGCGEQPAPGVVALRQSDPAIHLQFLDEDGRVRDLQAPLYGVHNAANIRMAILVGQHFGLSGEDLIAAIASYAPDNNRSQRLQCGDTLLLMDAYNANPESMAFSLSSFALLAGEKKIAILGDMLELGEATDREHQAMADHARALGFTEVVLVGPAFARVVCPPYWVRLPDAPTVRVWLQGRQLAGYSILLKGSRGMALERSVDFLLTKEKPII
jgi:UDP-N-acetylmuramoyl-tripeptide--D-alanyl-D-alanine ligase